MKITVFKNYGYCWGVKRAVDIAVKELNDLESAYILGPIIHNPNTNDKLKKDGLKIVSSVAEVPDGSVFFFPSHGISKTDEEFAAEKSLRTVSLICPFVIKIEQLAIDYEKKGYKVIIYGDPLHTEVKSMVSRLNSAQVVKDEEGVKGLELHPKMLYISQSTQNRDVFYSIFSKLAAAFEWRELIGRFTICQDTFERQDWMANHIEDFEFFIIVGGHQSSNTKKLVEIADLHKKKSVHIEKWDPSVWNMVKGLNNIAVISGTSTNKEDVDEVVNEIKGRLTQDGNNAGIYYA
ncbi:4-hydroxy-3-methylbut-2-enyl diphosphate reductase [bacterium]|nr:4-hydroxy-3-methylbut-2-enyl diphosphate reductase [bacterium]